MRPPMRSSIACTRCRKSKIKCENKNGEIPCESCVKTGSQCIFKVPDPMPPKRLEPPAIVKQERDGGSDRKRFKKTDDTRDARQRAMANAEEVLSASFLTEDLWEQLLDLYKLHIAAELPFLHVPTIIERLNRRSKAAHFEHNLDSNLVLLGILTLTARFHPDLVRYTAHQSSSTRPRTASCQPDPSLASDYYADVLVMALGPVKTMMGTVSLDRVAALLMLGLYAWSQTQPKSGGIEAWLYVGFAIRMAQSLGLEREGAGELEDADIRDLRLKDISCQPQLALRKEIKRRMMFSCFILDKMLACGKNRTSIVQSEDLKIQLPCSESFFEISREVRTGSLHQLECDGDDNLLSRFIQLVKLWGDISKYSFRGGRVEDKYPPWNPSSDFYALTKDLELFDSNLPSAFTFSRSNYYKNNESPRVSSTFVLLHMLRFVCLIMLHREYVPFVPIRCREPEGPLDHPTFTKEETPAGFWRTSAEQLFKAARGIVDLIEICQKKDKLPQSTIVLFAVWTASFVGLYGAHFSQMDTERHMLSFNHEDVGDDVLKEIFTRGPTAVTFHTLLKMANWQKMASAYVDILHGMNEYFNITKQDYYKYSDKNGRPNKATLQVRKGGIGGGLEEYQPMTPLKDLGFLQPSQQGIADLSEQFRKRGAENGASARSAPPMSFTAINHRHGSSLPTPTPARPLSAAMPSPEAPHILPGPYAEPRRYPNVPWHPPQMPPIQTYPTPSSVLDPEPAVPPAYEPGLMDDSEQFWERLQMGELHRFADSCDLSLLSTGEPEIPTTDMPFGGSWY
ncbi:fungal-specific transcription factor domain-containing protein [Xylaria arbuscula]|nr:fungal-specific transcription factor domain-containing protein [Xylaria arbuscula]